MQTTKQYLMQAQLYDAHISCKLEELSMLKALREKITSTLKAEAASSGMSQSKIEETTVKIIDLERDINDQIDAYVDKKKEIQAVIERVQNPEQVKVLSKRYLLGEKLEQIACEEYMSYRGICYVHRDALKAVEAILAEGNNGEES